MNSDKYPVTSYVPNRPVEDLHSTKFEHSLDYNLKKQKYERIINNPEHHFKNCYVTNFDIIHHECRGDKLSHDRNFYNTISNKEINQNFIGETSRKTDFISSAVLSKRKDMFFEKVLLKEHLMKISIEKKLKGQNVFLSSMKKRAFLKKKKCTDDCNSLSY